MTRVWPLAGRSREMRFIADMTRRRSGASGIVLAGEAGVGKTRLAREALDHAAGRGVTVRWAGATRSARSLPLGAFGPIVGEPGTDPIRLLRRAMDTLLANPGPGGVLIGIDDAHLLDDVSALLVHQLALRRSATLVVTLRSGEPTPDAITALWKDGHLGRLDLQPLSEDETAGLLEAVLGGQVDSHSAHDLWKITRGNLLFLHHLVAAELDSGHLREVNGIWRRPGRSRPSQQLTELVDARIGRLSDELCEVVDLLAFGEPLGASLLTALATPSAVEQAERRGLITIDGDGRRLPARLAHPLYGEVQRARTSTLRARALRGRLATAITSSGARRGEDLLRAAVLALDSDMAPDPAMLTDAGWRATQLFDLGLAARLGRAACVAGGGFGSHLLLAYALSWQGRSLEAEQQLERVFALAENDDQRTAATVPMVGNLFFGLCRTDEAESILRAALDSVSGRPARLVLEAMSSAVDGLLGRPRQAVARARAVLAAPEPGDQAVLFAGWGIGLGLGLQGRTGELLAILAELRLPAGTSETSMLWFALAQIRVVVLRMAGRLADLRQLAQHCAELAADTPGIAPLISDVLLAESELATGRARTAARAAHRASAALAEELDPGGWVFNSRLSLTEALGMAGDATAARQSLTELDRVVHPAFAYRAPDITLARAWVAAAEGAVREAIGHAHHAAETAVRFGHAAQEVVALHTAACFGDHTVGPRLAELASIVDGPRAQLAAAHGTALARQNGDALDAVSAELEQMGTLLIAADAAAQASSLHQRHGSAARSAVSAARARALASACDGARTPALAAITQPVALTAREREIAMLVANGLSNKDVAERLTVSVRTVEGHVYRACTKLRVADRAALAEAIRAETNASYSPRL
ncbi:MAG: AAA family ATPase [Pseudonocardiaceae bacterium]|nr:AAA family ATPase [Pseudonocardiaceae bacterium]